MENNYTIHQREREIIETIHQREREIHNNTS
jgi:hypothetical protein